MEQNVYIKKKKDTKILERLDEAIRKGKSLKHARFIAYIDKQ